jgi:hypothetical protein
MVNVAAGGRHQPGCGSRAAQPAGHGVPRLGGKAGCRPPGFGGHPARGHWLRADDDGLHAADACRRVASEHAGSPRRHAQHSRRSGAASCALAPDPGLPQQPGQHHRLPATPRNVAASVSGNWSGYADETDAPPNYAQMYWTVPHPGAPSGLGQTDYSSIWPGIGSGDPGGGELIQDGTEQNVSCGRSLMDAGIIPRPTTSGSRRSRPNPRKKSRT